MTGFGKATLETTDKTINIEIRSLNSKQLDLATKVCPPFREKDSEIRKALAKELKRGKVEFYMNSDSKGSTTSSKINTPVIQGYFENIKELNGDISFSQVLPSLLTLPDAVITEQTELVEDDWLSVLDSIHKAVADINKFRLQEGAALEVDFVERIGSIETYLSQVVEFEQLRIEKIKNRITQHVEEFSKGTDFNPERFEQELIYYLEKLDITEEKIRLANHCSYFKETLALPESNGKKLGFICQEIGREINTIGSKANDADMQKLVVLMKDELEKIKEQVLNVL